MRAAQELAPVLRTLQRRYGNGQPCEPRDPFAMILWENAAYLVSDEVRTRVFAELKKRIGIDPVRILAAPARELEQTVREGGMHPQHRAEKLRRCAAISLEFASGDLSTALKTLSLQKARALLKKFPGIGDPGADKILLLCGYAAVPALESNGLRVLARLGFAEEDPSYARAYKLAISVLKAAEPDLEAAFFLLRAHGRELCRRNEPLCTVCPVSKGCFYRRAAGGNQRSNSSATIR